MRFRLNHPLIGRMSTDVLFLSTEWNAANAVALVTVVVTRSGGSLRAIVWLCAFLRSSFFWGGEGLIVVVVDVVAAAAAATAKTSL